MKIRELFEELGEAVSDRLYEMAFSKRDVESKITSLSVPIIEHLIKVLKWEDELNYDKHIRDISSWIRQIKPLKFKGNKFPKERDYYQWMFLDHFTSEHDISEWVKDLTNYHQLTAIRDNEHVYFAISEIIKNISHDLAFNNLKDIKSYVEYWKV
jgi:TusA-related sulfurtransferase